MAEIVLGGLANLGWSEEMKPEDPFGKAVQERVGQFFTWYLRENSRVWREFVAAGNRSVARNNAEIRALVVKSRPDGLAIWKNLGKVNDRS